MIICVLLSSDYDNNVCLYDCFKRKTVEHSRHFVSDTPHTRFFFRLPISFALVLHKPNVIIHNTRYFQYFDFQIYNITHIYYLSAVFSFQTAMFRFEAAM